MRFTMLLNTKIGENKPPVQLMLSRENLNLVKFLIFLWSRNTPRDTQSVETRNAFILPRWNTSQLILAKIGHLTGKTLYCAVWLSFWSSPWPSADTGTD